MVFLLSSTIISSSAKVRKKNKSKNAPGNRSDPGWEHRIEVDNAKRKVKCRHCGIVRFGGIYRLKHHLAGTKSNAEPCPKVPKDVRRKFIAILESRAEDKFKKKRLYNLQDDDNDRDNLVEEPQPQPSKGKGIHIGAMDKYVRKTKQATMNQMFKKEDREKVCQQIARFFYTSAIPFNCVNNPEFGRMVDMISRFGTGLKPPSYHEIRVKYLKEVTLTLGVLEEYKIEWKKTGCSIMSDGWSDKKR